MSNDLLSGTFINLVLSFLLKRTTVPSTYHDQVEVIKEMLSHDVSGLVDGLTDFAVESADVDYTIKTGNDELDSKLNRWLNEELNADYDGQVPIGIRALAQEYFRERWKSSSFIALKILDWKEIDGLHVPSKVVIVDGGSIYEESNSTELKIGGYKYFLGKSKKEKLSKGVIFQKPFARWFDRYSKPFLIKRGVYQNYKIIESLKTKQVELLNQVIPYMLLLQRGSEQLALASTKGEGGYHYDDNELQEIKDKFQEKYQEWKDKVDEGAFTRVTQFDEMIKHFIPDMGAMFATELFIASEKAILAGLGFVDIAETIASNRKESILNPTAFIREIECGIKDFKALINELYIRIKRNNLGDHRKYMNKKHYIISSPIQGFNTDRFRQLVRQYYTAGLLSKQTAVELGLEINFANEVERRKKETAQGLDLEMYPPVTDNREGQGMDLHKQPIEPKKEKDDGLDPKDLDKQDPSDKKEYDVGSLLGATSVDEDHSHTYELNEKGNGHTSINNDHFHVIKNHIVIIKNGHIHTLVPMNAKKTKQDDLEEAPFNQIKDLPKQIKKALSTDLQGVFLRVFNNAFKNYQSETRAFQVAWSVIKQIARKNKKGIWVRKRKRVDGKLKKLQLTQGLIEKAFIEADEKEMTSLKREEQEKRLELINKLLGKKNEEN